MPYKRPLGVTLLLWMVLFLSAWGAVRFAASLRAWNALSEFESSLSPLYLAITGAGWAAAGGVLLWGALNRRRWAHPALPVYPMLGLVILWIERLFFQSARDNPPLAVILSVVLLVVTGVCALHRSTKNYLKRSEEHEQHKQHPAPE